jgi:hypothetical protein
MSAMNLALQTRRAVITLSLLALAMVCVAAKTATGTNALSADAPAHAGSAARGVCAAPADVRVVAPVAVTVKTQTVAHRDVRIIRL